MFGEPFKYLQNYYKVQRKISQSLSKWSFLQNFTLPENLKLLRSRRNSDFKVSRILPLFASISENESFILSCFWLHSQELLTSNLLNRYSISMIVQCLQFFLTSEKKNSLKKHVIVVACKSFSMTRHFSW